MKKIFSIIGVTLLLAGCKPDVSANPHDVSSYAANPAARAQGLQQCRNNPGVLAIKPECVNAEVADNKTSLGTNSGYRPHL